MIHAALHPKKSPTPHLKAFHHLKSPQHLIVGDKSYTIRPSTSITRCISMQLQIQFVTNCYFIEKQSNKKMISINTKDLVDQFVKPKSQFTTKEESW